MHINYILLAHQHPLQLARLVRAISTPNTSFYIHIDQKTDWQPFKGALAGNDNIHWLQNRHACTWGDSSIVMATLEAMKVMVAGKKEGYCVLLSGQDYPLRSNREIEAFLQENNGRCFMEACPMPDGRWPDSKERLHHYKFDLSCEREHTVLIPSVFAKDFYKGFKQHMRNIRLLLCMKKKLPLVLLRKRTFPAYCKPYGGSQWWAIRVTMAAAVLDFLEQHPDYLPFFKYTYVPDEIFFHSIIMYLLAAQNGQPADPITYADWAREDVPLPVTFTTADWKGLRQLPPGKLFARKFDAAKDTHILDLIDRHRQGVRQKAVKKV